MNEFWLWFWRPLAEMLGVFAMLVVGLAIYAAWKVAVHLWNTHAKERG